MKSYISKSYTKNYNSTRKNLYSNFSILTLWALQKFSPLFFQLFMKNLFHAAGIRLFSVYTEWYVCKCFIVKGILCRSALCNEKQIHFFLFRGYNSYMTIISSSSFVYFPLKPPNLWRAHFTIYYHLQFSRNSHPSQFSLRLDVQRVIRERSFARLEMEFYYTLTM